METTILQWVVGVRFRVDNGKEHGNYRIIVFFAPLSTPFLGEWVLGFGFRVDNGKEHGNYRDYWG